MRPRGTPEELERRRLRAVELLREGRSVEEIAQLLEVTRRSVERWRRSVRRAGKRALRAKAASGRPRKLESTDRTRLEMILLEGAQAHGFGTDLWTCPRVAAVIRARFGVSYHVDHIPKLLHQMGWSVQKPVRRAIERDEAAIARWIKKEWPRVKKTQSGSGR